MERERAIRRRREHAVEHERVGVHVKIDRAAEPLQARDHPRLAPDHTGTARLPPVVRPQDAHPARQRM